MRLFVFFMVVFCIGVSVAKFQCGDGYCDDGNTCCYNGKTGGYGCCFHSQATCCTNEGSCCAHGKYCAEDGRCVSYRAREMLLRVPITNSKPLGPN